MDTTLLSPAIGVEVKGIDARATIDDATAAELRDLFDRHHLLLLRDQDLRPEDQVRFTGLFGAVIDESGSGANYSYVSNRRPDSGVTKEGRLLWHADNMWSPSPNHCIALYGMEIEGDLAPTRYASTVRAVAALSPDLHQRVEGMRTVNMSDLGPGPERPLGAGSTGPGEGDDAPGNVLTPDVRTVLQELPADEYLFPRTSYPIIWPHPRTGAPMLTVEEYFSVRIEGLDAQSGEALYQELFAVLYDEQFVYEHHWRQGDLVVWDNLALQHSRPAFYGAPGVRTLSRTTIQPGYDEWLAHAPRVIELGKLIAAAKALG